MSESYQIVVSWQNTATVTQCLVAGVYISYTSCCWASHTGKGKVMLSSLDRIVNLPLSNLQREIHWPSHMHMQTEYAHFFLLQVVQLQGNGLQKIQERQSISFILISSWDNLIESVTRHASNAYLFHDRPTSLQAQKEDRFDVLSCKS